jgi:glyoxylase-like metal-dependent hydrolase (beta-lactamase superfamily II)
LGLAKIIDDVYVAALGTANTVLLDGVSELALVDVCLSGKVSVVLDAIRQLGRSPHDLRHVIFTHHHPDHFSSSAVIIRKTGVATYLDPIDAPIAEIGGPLPPHAPSAYDRPLPGTARLPVSGRANADGG